MGEPDANAPVEHRCEQIAAEVKAPPMALIPFRNGPLHTLAADGFTAVTVPGQPFAILAIGHSQMGQGLHIAMSPHELRVTAAGLLQSADYLDGGKGKQ